MNRGRSTGDGVRAVLCCDLDGVVWTGRRPVPGAADAIRSAAAAGWRIGFLTNNSSAPVDEVVDRLAALGVPCRADDVITSAQSAAAVLAGRLAPGSRVLVVGGPGVRGAVVAVGLTPVEEPPAAAVVVGWDRRFDFERLDRAAAAVRAGALFVATNRDPTYPDEGRLLPGAGSMVAAVATAAGTEPMVAGKPEEPTVRLVRERFGPTGVVVGDRPSTDGALAAALGWPFALVLSGVTSREAVRGGEAIPHPVPDYVANDLVELVPRLGEATGSTRGQRPGGSGGGHPGRGASGGRMGRDQPG